MRNTAITQAVKGPDRRYPGWITVEVSHNGQVVGEFSTRENDPAVKHYNGSAAITAAAELKKSRAETSTLFDELRRITAPVSK